MVEEKKMILYETATAPSGDCMKMEISDTINTIDETAWQKLVGTYRADGSYEWFKTIEESGMRNMFYVTINKNINPHENALAAAACCRIRTEHIHTLKMPLLDVRPVYFETLQQLKLLITGLNTLQTQLNTKGITLCFHNTKKLAMVQKELNMSTQFPLKDNTYIDLKFKTFEDYLDWLPSRTRRSIRNTLNKAEKWNIKTVFTHELSTWKKEASRLHRYLCQEHNDYSFYVQEKFYDILEKNLKDRAELLIFLKDGTPLSFALVLNSSCTALYKFAGIDPGYRKYQSYFLIYYEGIKKAIERKQNRIYFGPTSYDFKERIGCKRETGVGIAKMQNPLVNMVSKLYMWYHRVWGKKI
jgi:predicted N-acyltransferase